jgi:hypothetical protein
MLFAVGWCVLRTSRSAYETATVADVDVLDSAIRDADEKLWAAFKTWMRDHESPWLLWSLIEHHNNHDGLLQAYISRNHRASPFWEMLKWIEENAIGSYGLFYVHDDEDFVDPQYGRAIPESYANVFRVHRILNGKVSELPDPFFGPIVPQIEPLHPYDRPDNADIGI